MKHASALTVALALIAGTAACGGGSGNSQLKRRVTHQHLAPMPAAERAQEAELYREVFLAAWQIEYTKGQIDAAELEVKIAKNDLASSKIGMKSAGIKMKAAEEAGELNKIDETKKSERIALLEIDVHKLNIDRAKLNLAYLKKRLDHEEHLHRSREAELESVKADSLKSAGIKPPDFDANKYKSQFKDRQAQAKASEADVVQSKKELQALEARLATANKTLQVAKAGGPATPPEPIEPTEIVEPLDPIEPVQPVEPVPPIEPVQPVEPLVPEAGTKTQPAPTPTESGSTPTPKGN